jgi:23S rRNA-/tRNA-specific pseudouridylate synthase
MKRLLTGIKNLTGKTINDIACNSRLGVQKLKDHGKIRTAEEIGEVATINVNLSSLMQNDLVTSEKQSKSTKIEKKLALKLKNETIKANSLKNGYGIKSSKDLFSKGSTDKVDVGSLILFEDNHLLVLNKVAGVLTQGDKSESHSLLDMAKKFLVHRDRKDGDAYLGLVHRLDRPCSGVLVFAKTSKAASRLSEAFRLRKVEKGYVCVVNGVAPQVQKCEHYLEKTSAEKVRVFDKSVLTDSAVKIRGDIKMI